MRERSDKIDKAWGTASHCAPIGNPLDHGVNYERLGGKMRARLDRAEARRYRALVSSRGRELNHILRETDDLRERLGVSPNQLPALAFRTSPFVPPCLLLHIKRQWLANEDAQVALSQALQESFSGEQVRKLVEPGSTTVGELLRRAQALVDEVAPRMHRTLRHQVFASPRKVTRRGVLLAIDVMSHRATYKGKDLDLTLQEFRTLCELARTARLGSGWVKRIDLEELLWKDEVAAEKYPTRRRLDPVIKRVRAAFRRIPGMTPEKARRLIKARRHVGFRLDLLPKQISLT